MRPDEEIGAMETSEYQAILKALRSGAAPSPEFRARLRQSFLVEAQSDAHRRRAYSPWILGLPKRYIRFAAAGAVAALVLITIAHSGLFRPTPALRISRSGEPGHSLEAPAGSRPDNALQIAESVDESSAGVRGVVFGLESGAMGFAPRAGDRKDAVDAVASSAFTPETANVLEQIAAEAGGIAESLGNTEVITVPSAVLDHVLSRLDQAIGLTEITKPVHLDSDEVAVYITFSPD